MSNIDKIFHYRGVIICVILSFCGGGMSCSKLYNRKITEKNMKKYLQAVENIRQVQPDFIGRLAVISAGQFKPARLPTPHAPEANKVRKFGDKSKVTEKKSQLSRVKFLNQKPEAMRKIEESIRKAGFRNYAEFAALNGKIISLYNSLESHGPFGQMKLATAAQEKGFRKLLADPNIPDKAKMVLRARREEVRALHRDNINKLKRQMGAVNFVTDTNSLSIVKRHKDRLRKIYSRGIDAREINQKRFSVLKEKMLKKKQPVSTGK